MTRSPAAADPAAVIRTPDQRLRVFISSTIKELAEERETARRAIENLRLAPVLFEQGARPHPARSLYLAYLAQSHIFIAIYWQSYGWIAPELGISGLEDEYLHAQGHPRLIYVKTPAAQREPRLAELLNRIKSDADVSYKYFSSAAELGELIQNDLALILTERFEQSRQASRLPEVEGEGRAGVPGGVPHPLSALIGREASLQALRGLLLRPEVRLATLSGPGGVGKTRLSQEVAAGLEDAFPDGVYWVPLAAISEPGLVISAIAQALDVRERAGVPLLNSLSDYLKNRRILLVLDNFEQVASAAPLLADLLASAAHLKALVTSRAALRLRGEHEYPVPPLELPDRSGAHLPERIQESAAVLLFVERARLIQPAFELTPENTPQVVEIVTRLDGLPLAIELAAARMKLLSPAVLLKRLGASLDVLAGGPSDLPERQQTMRKTIQWSFDLLEAAQQRIFARLSVFSGGFTLEAAEAVCGGDAGLDIYDGIEALLNSSLLRQEPGADAAPRFGFLETIREFALEKLAEAGEPGARQQRHAEYYAQLAEAIALHQYSGESEAALDRLAAEYSNFRVALAFCQGEARTQETGWQLTAELVWMWYRRGYLNEARHWYEIAIQQTRDRENDNLKATLLRHAGLVAMWQSDFIEAARLMDAGLPISRSVADPLSLAMGLFTRGVLATNQGEAQIAEAVFDESLQMFRQLGQEWFQAMIVLHLGNLALSRGDIATTRSRIQESFDLGRRVGARWIIASAINNFGEIARYRGDYPEAEKHYLDSRELFTQIGSSPDVARADHSLGYVALSRGQLDRAQSLFESSLQQHQKLGVKRGVLEALAGFAALKVAQGQPEACVRLIAAAQSQFNRLRAGVWAADQADMERNLALASALLDRAAFDAACQAGASLALDEAIRVARGPAAA